VEAFVETSARQGGPSVEIVPVKGNAVCRRALSLLAAFLLASTALGQSAHSSSKQPELKQINLTELGIVLKLGEVHTSTAAGGGQRSVAIVTEFSIKGTPIELGSPTAVKRGASLVVVTKQYGSFSAVTSATGEVQLWGSEGQRQKLVELSKSFDLPLSGQTEASVRPCRDVLGGRLKLTEPGAIVADSCGWAVLSKHSRLSGDFLGIVVQIPPGTPAVDLNPENTYLEYEDRSDTGWVAWFPNRAWGEEVEGEYGTSVSVKIDMPGIGSGEAAGASSSEPGPQVMLGYGSMLFLGNRMNVDWNMAYCDMGMKDGTLTVDVQKSPGTSRLLLLFRKHDSGKVLKLHIAGSEYDVQP
jgi:hypothetical protein